jgi:ferrochelatase
VPVAEVRSFPDDPAFVAALSRKVAGTVAAARADAAPEPLHLLFSAHGVPVSFVERGDPYLGEVERTVAAVMREFPGVPHSLSFQSRTGPVKWLEPDTVGHVASLGRDGVKTLVVVPVSFVSDHIETLHELDVRLRETARAAGIADFRRVPALNDSPDFIEALRDLVVREVSP